MRTTPLMVAVAAMLVSLPAHGQDKADKGKDWCTEAHMTKMDADIAKMTDAAKKKEAAAHLAQSKEAMKKKNTADCVKHMEATHKAMGL